MSQFIFALLATVFVAPCALTMEIDEKDIVNVVTHQSLLHENHYMTRLSSGKMLCAFRNVCNTTCTLVSCEDTSGMFRSTSEHTIDVKYFDLLQKKFREQKRASFDMLIIHSKK